jgi:DNA-binding transcriptional LysR family regulator
MITPPTPGNPRSPQAPHPWIGLDQLDVFFVVARHMSFTRAAEELLVTQPAVTRRIEHLESRVGQALFDRRPGRLTLTQAGAVLLPYAQAIHEAGRAAATALADFKTEPTGVLRLAAPSMLMARYISPFHELYPYISVKFRRGTYEEMIKGLLEGDTDVGVLPMMAPDPRVDASPFPGLEHEPLVAVVPTGHRLAHQTRLSLAELTREPVVIRGGILVREMVEAWAESRGGSLHIVAEAPSSDDVKQLVLAGVGVGILPWMGVEQDIRAGLFTSLVLEDGSLTLAMYVVTARGRPRSAATEAFLEFIRTVSRLDIAMPGQRVSGPDPT